MGYPAELTESMPTNIGNKLLIYFTTYNTKFMPNLPPFPHILPIFLTILLHQFLNPLIFFIFFLIIKHNLITLTNIPFSKIIQL